MTVIDSRVVNLDELKLEHFAKGDTFECNSTMLPAEVCEYPDSKKIGAFGGGLRHMTRTDGDVDYWADEV